MSTRSNIAIVLEDGTNAKRIYCHSDGYPSYNGKLLLENYTDPEKIKQLIQLGNISSLGPEIGEKHDFDDYDLASKNGWTRAYGRDRGEKGQSAQIVKLKVLRGWESILEQEYLYLWKDSAWYYSDHGSKLKKLTKKVCKN